PLLLRMRSRVIEREVVALIFRLCRREGGLFSVSQGRPIAEESASQAQLILRLKLRHRCEPAEIDGASQYDQPLETFPSIYYSCRRATTGSTFIAERAGISVAMRATSVSSSATSIKLTGSYGLMLNSRLLSTRDSASAATSPTTPPSAISRTLSHRISRRILNLLAPSAMRTPIS